MYEVRNLPPAKLLFWAWFATPEKTLHFCLTLIYLSCPYGCYFVIRTRWIFRLSVFIGKGYTSITFDSTRLVTVLVYTTIVDSPSSFDALDNRPCSRLRPSMAFLHLPIIWVLTPLSTGIGRALFILPAIFRLDSTGITYGVSTSISHSFRSSFFILWVH